MLDERKSIISKLDNSYRNVEHLEGLLEKMQNIQSTVRPSIVFESGHGSDILKVEIPFVNAKTEVIRQINHEIQSELKIIEENFERLNEKI